MHEIPNQKCLQRGHLQLAQAILSPETKDDSDCLESQFMRGYLILSMPQILDDYMFANLYEFWTKHWI